MALNTRGVASEWVSAHDVRREVAPVVYRVLKELETSGWRLQIPKPGGYVAKRNVVHIATTGRLTVAVST